MESQTGKLISRPLVGTFATSLFAAFFIYILEIIFIIAFTALIYSGELASQIPRALGFIITSNAILCAVAAALSSNPGSIAVEQDTLGAMLGIIAALPGAVPTQFATVTMMIVTTTLLTSLLLLGLGAFKLGGLARFLPFPVIGGFLAGSGWLLVQGGAGIREKTRMGGLQIDFGIDEDTCREPDDFIQVEPLGKQLFKGKTIPVQIYSVFAPS